MGLMRLLMSDQHLRPLERRWKQSPTDDAARDYMAELARNGKIPYADWLRFLGGSWSLDIPAEEGSYMVATADGYSCGFNLAILLYKDPETGEMRAARGNYTQTPSSMWGGYWWNEPLPKMPEPAKKHAKKTN